MYLVTSRGHQRLLSRPQVTGSRAYRGKYVPLNINMYNHPSDVSLDQIVNTAVKQA